LSQAPSTLLLAVKDQFHYFVVTVVLYTVANAKVAVADDAFFV